MLKPALQAGELRCIGASTHAEYKQTFGKDRALARRFQVIDIDEPSLEDAIEILKGITPAYAEFHGVSYEDEAIEQAARMASEHLRESKLPDNAIDIIDETGAAAKLASIESVTVEEVEQTVARMAKIPPKSVSEESRGELETLESELLGLVFGQESCPSGGSSIKLSRAGLKGPNTPIGFLFVGPTGVGKTELAKQLASVMGIHFSDLICRISRAPHSFPTGGAPPGYVGFEQGGLLTEAINQLHTACCCWMRLKSSH